MRNRKNIVLMFLIIMLSFAIVSEVSATSTDDAELGDDILNDKPSTDKDGLIQYLKEIEEC